MHAIDSTGSLLQITIATVQFASSDECDRFQYIFDNLGREAKARALNHLAEYISVRESGK